jgi:hypothetical protein
VLQQEEALSRFPAALPAELLYVIERGDAFFSGNESGGKWRHFVHFVGFGQPKSIVPEVPGGLVKHADLGMPDYMPGKVFANGIRNASRYPRNLPSFITWAATALVF